MRVPFCRSAVLVALVLAFGCAFSSAKSSDKRDSTVVIPAGTKITVQLNYQHLHDRRELDGKVTWPVQSGFATHIPVGSKVTAYVFTQYLEEYGLQNFVQLTSVTIGGHTYPIETNTLELQTGTIETKFTLAADLELKR